MDYCNINHFSVVVVVVVNIVAVMVVVIDALVLILFKLVGFFLQKK